MLYIAHGNRPTYLHMVEECLLLNYALVCLDFHGHGYSEGTPRAYVDDFGHLLDDATCLIREVYSDSLDLHECGFNEHVSGHHKHRNNSKSVATEKSQHERSDTSEQQQQTPSVYNLRANKVPFHIMGQSMGGAVAIRLGLYYQQLATTSDSSSVNESDSEGGAECTSGLSWLVGGAGTTSAELHKSSRDAGFASLFISLILLAPAITSNLPPPVVRMVFENVFVPLFPTTSIPTALSGAKVDDNSAIWTSEKFVEYACVKDKHHKETNPHGLSFGEPIRFRTAYSLVQMMQSIQNEISLIRFPFIIFHDPEDAVIQYAGSLKLLHESSTPANKKHLYNMPNAKHDLFTNRLSVIVKQTLKWIESVGDQ